MLPAKPAPRLTSRLDKTCYKTCCSRGKGHGGWLTKGWLPGPRGEGGPAAATTSEGGGAPNGEATTPPCIMCMKGLEPRPSVEPPPPCSACRAASLPEKLQLRRLPPGPLRSVTCCGSGGSGCSARSNAEETAAIGISRPLSSERRCPLSSERRCGDAAVGLLRCRASRDAVMPARGEVDMMPERGDVDMIPARGDADMMPARGDVDITDAFGCCPRGDVARLLALLLSLLRCARGEVDRGFGPPCCTEQHEQSAPQRLLTLLQQLCRAAVDTTCTCGEKRTWWL